MRFKSSGRILLIGGRSKTKSMAISLIKQGFKVTVINNNNEDCKRLAEIPGLNVIYGDGTQIHILDQADAYEVDIAIALNNKDEDNLVACQLCKKLFKVQKTVSLLADPNKTAFFYAAGIDIVVCAVSILSNLIQQQALINEMNNIIPIGEGKAQIAQVKILTGSPIIDKKLYEISFPTDTIIGCILRKDSFIIPRGDTRILEEDTLVVIAGTQEDLNKIYLLTEGN